MTTVFGVEWKGVVNGETKVHHLQLLQIVDVDRFMNGHVPSLGDRPLDLQDVLTYIENYQLKADLEMLEQISSVKIDREGNNDPRKMLRSDI